MFDNVLFDNYLDLVRQLKNRSFLGHFFVHVTGRNKSLSLESVTVKAKGEKFPFYCNRSDHKEKQFWVIFFQKFSNFFFMSLTNENIFITINFKSWTFNCILRYYNLIRVLLIKICNYHFCAQIQSYLAHNAKRKDILVVFQVFWNKSFSQMR